MDGNHVHVQVKDLEGALAWFSKMLDVKPNLELDGVAVLPYGPILLVLDRSEDETVAKIGYASKDCHADVRGLTARGAVVLKEPVDFDNGIRAAFIQGPGRLTIEVEQRLRPEPG